MLRKRAPNPSFPWHRAHLFIFLAVGCPAQRVFRRTLVPCLRCAFQNRILHLNANDRFAFFWTTICIFWTAASLGLCVGENRPTSEFPVALSWGGRNLDIGSSRKLSGPQSVSSGSL